MIVELAFPKSTRRAKNEPTGIPETLTHTVCPTSKLAFGVVQSESKVSIVSPTGGTGKRKGLKESFRGGETGAVNFTAAAAAALFCETMEESLFATLLVIEAEDTEKNGIAISAMAATNIPTRIIRLKRRRCERGQDAE